MRAPHAFERARSTTASRKLSESSDPVAARAAARMAADGANSPRAAGRKPHSATHATAASSMAVLPSLLHASAAVAIAAWTAFACVNGSYNIRIRSPRHFGHVLHVP
eukprot:6492264-Prymnesium_polylepis.1